MSRKKAEMLLMLAIALRATSLLFSKIALTAMTPYSLLALRFVMAFLVLAVIFRKQLQNVTRKTVLHGMILGGTFTMMMSFELHALQTTPSSVTSFLENTAIVLVPLLLVPISRKLPHRGTVISALLALSGVGILTLNGGKVGFTSGEILCLLGASSYALAIIFTGKFSKTDDGLQLGILQNGFIGLFATILAFTFEHPELPQTATGWGSVLALTLVCSVLGFTIQPIAQQYVPTETAGLFCGLNPLIASTLGVVFLNENLGWNGLAGAACIIGAIVASHLLENTKESTPATASVSTKAAVPATANVPAMANLTATMKVPAMANLSKQLPAIYAWMFRHWTTANYYGNVMMQREISYIPHLHPARPRRVHL